MAAERLDAYMARANAAYYAERDPFADFTTAPEISQVFGELLGAWAAVVWQTLGRPDPVLWVEAGPGRGTLMSDALRAVRRTAPDFAAAAQIRFIETSPRLRRCQQTLVPEAAWHDDLDAVPPGPMILFANEFLDALPIRQFVRHGGHWQERYVDGGAFVLVDSDTPVRNVVARREGDVVEIAEAAWAWCRRAGRRLADQGGAALLIDYGYEGPAIGDTLQALRDGKPADPLAAPGEADLTAHVDFAAVAEMFRASGCRVLGPVGVGRFLASLGLFQRTARLGEAHPDRAASLREAADRLAAPTRMGTLFQVLAAIQPGLPEPPGFA